MANKIMFYAERITQEIRGKTLMDDDYMMLFFRDNKECVQILLRIVLKKDDIIVKTVKVQHVMQGAAGTRSIRIDVYAIDSDGTQYDIEIQKENSGANPLRARFNIAILDSNALQPGDKHEKLRDCKSFVIFITQKDYFKMGRPLYIFERVDTDAGIKLNDGSTIVYVNGSFENLDTELGKLIHDFNCDNPYEMFYQEFADSARAANKKRAEYNMSVIEELWEDASAEGEASGKAKGREEATIHFATNLIKRGKDTFEEIASLCAMSVAQVQAIAQSIGK